MNEPARDQPETLEPILPSLSGTDAAPAATLSPAAAVAAATTADLPPPLPAGGAVDQAGGTTDFIGNDPAATTDEPATAGRGAESAGRTLPPGGRGRLAQSKVAGYEILGVLGRGAMGVVYQARQRGLKRIVALKMILAGDHASEHDLARFRAEADSVASLQHANIVQLYEVGEEDGKPFFSLEFVDGSTLSQRIAGTPQPAREAAELMQLLAAAMEYAHRHGVVHRDLKPSNILLTTDGVPKISDFGLAKQVEEDSGQTKSGTILGTPSYMAPEQAEGRIKDVGPVSDVYGLGAILYELLTGRPPFRAESLLETLTQVRMQEPVPPHLLQPKTPRDLETICLTCLRKEPARRYASAAALAEDLRRFVAGEPIQARPVPAWERLARWCRRNPRIAVLAGSVAALLVAIAVGSFAFAAQLRGKNELLNAKVEELAETNEALVQSNAAENKAREEAVRNERKAIAHRDEAIVRHGQAYENTRRLTRAVYNRVRQREQQAGPARPELRALREEVAQIFASGMLQLAAQFDQSQATRLSRVAGVTALADQLREFGRKQEALKQYQLARDLLLTLLAAEPDSDKIKRNLAALLSRIAQVGPEVGADLGEARNQISRALQLEQDVLDHPHPEQYTPQENRIRTHEGTRFLANYFLQRGQLNLRSGNVPAAGKDFVESTRLRKLLSDAEPNDASLLSYLAEPNLWTAIACWHLGDEPAAEEAFRKTVAICEGLLNSHRGSADYSQDLATVYGAYGEARLRLGKAEEAWQHYETAEQYIRYALARSPLHLERQAELALTCERLGTTALLLPERRAGAAAYFEEAVKLRQGLLEEEPNNLAAQAALMRACSCGGRLTEAVRLAEGLRRKAPQNVEYLVQIAGCYGRCAAAAQGPDRQAMIAKALAALREAVQRDYRDAVAVQTDPDLEALRPEAEFRQLVAKLEAR